MVQLLLVAVGAGAAAALAAAGVALLPLAPLPILIAAIGWSHFVGLVSALLAAAIVGLIFGGDYFLLFLFGVGLPSWWLAYLSMLARPVGTNGSDTLEWYPVGRLLFWAAILSALIVGAALSDLVPAFGSFQSELRTAMTQTLAILGRLTPEMLERPDVKRLIEEMLRAIPPGMAVLLTIFGTLNLWLAARIAMVSGRLRRPWPVLSEMALPSFTPGVLAAAVVGSFLSGLPGTLARLLATSLIMAYAIMGFAVLHAITRGMAGRSYLLAGAYLAVLVLGGYPILAMSLFGLAETVFKIRARFATSAAGPPTTST